MWHGKFFTHPVLCTPVFQEGLGIKYLPLSSYREIADANLKHTLQTFKQWLVLKYDYVMEFLINIEYFRDTVMKTYFRQAEDVLMASRRELFKQLYHEQSP